MLKLFKTILIRIVDPFFWQHFFSIVCLFLWGKYTSREGLELADICHPNAIQISQAKKIAVVRRWGRKTRFFPNVE